MSDHKPLTSFEADECSSSSSSSSDVVGDEDEEFVSCEELEEEVFPEDHSRIKKIGEVAESAAYARQKHSRNDRRNSVGNLYCDTESVKSTDLSESVFSPSGVDETSTDILEFSCGVERTNLLNDTSLCATKPASVEDRGLEATKEVDTRYNNINSENSVAEGFISENKDNSERLVLQLDIEQALFLASNKVSNSCLEETVNSLDDNEEEESEDDCEFHDTRSSLSRIQSVDDEHINIVEGLPQERHGMHVDTGKNSCNKDVVSPAAVCKNVNIPVSKDMDIEKSKINVVEDLSEERQGKHVNTGKDSCNKNVVSPAAVCKNVNIPVSEHVDIEKTRINVSQTHELKSVDSPKHQIDRPSITASGIEQRSFQEDISASSEPPIYLSDLECSHAQLTESKSSVETIHSGQHGKLTSTKQGLDGCTSLELPQIEQAEIVDSMSTMSSQILNSLVASYSFPDSLSLHNEVSEVCPTVNTTVQQVAEVCPPVNTTVQQVAEVCSTVNTTVQQVAEVCSTVNTTVQQVSEVLPTGNTTVQQISEVCPAVNTTVHEVSEVCPAMNTMVRHVSEVLPTGNTTVQQVCEVCPAMNTTLHEVSEVCPTVNTTVHEVSEVCPAVNTMVRQVSEVLPTGNTTVHEVSEVCPAVNTMVRQVSEVLPTGNTTVQQVSEVCPTVNTTVQVSEICPTVNTTVQQVSEVCPTVNTRVQVSEVCPPVYTTVQQVAEVCPTVQQISEVLPTVNTTVQQISEVLPTVNRTVQQVDEAFPTVNPTVQQVDEVCPTVNTTVQQVSEVLPTVNTTVQVSEVLPTVNTTVQQVSEVCPTVQQVSEVCSTVQQVSEVCPTVQQVSEVCPTVQQVSEVCPTVQQVSEVCPTVQVSEVCPTVNTTVQHVSEVLPTGNITVQQVSEVCPAVNTTVHEVSEVCPAVQQVSEVCPTVNTTVQVSDELTTVQQISEVCPTVNTRVQVSEVCPTVNTTVQQVDEACPTVNTRVQQVSEILPTVNTTVQQVSEVLSTVNTTVQQGSEELPTVNTTVQQVSEACPTVNTRVQVSEVCPPVTTTVQQVTKVCPTVQQISEVLPTVNPIVQQVDEACPTVNTTVQQVSEVPTVNTTVQQGSEELPTVNTTVQQVSELCPTVDTTVQQVSELCPTVNTTVQQVSEELPTVNTTVQQISEVLPTVNPTVQQVSEVLPTVNTTVQQVSEVLPTVNTTVHQVSEVLKTEQQVSEVLTMVNTTVQLSEVLPKVSTTVHQISEILPTVISATQVSEILPTINATVQVSEEIATVNTTVQVSEVLPIINTTVQVSEEIATVNTMVHHICEVLPPVNTTVQNESEMLATVRTTTQQVSDHLPTIVISETDVFTQSEGNSKILPQLSIDLKQVNHSTSSSSSQSSSLFQESPHPSSPPEHIDNSLITFQTALSLNESLSSQAVSSVIVSPHVPLNIVCSSVSVENSTTEDQSSDITSLAGSICLVGGSNNLTTSIADEQTENSQSLFLRKLKQLSNRTDAILPYSLTLMQDQGHSVNLQNTDNNMKRPALNRSGQHKNINSLFKFCDNNFDSDVHIDDNEEDGVSDDSLGERVSNSTDQENYCDDVVAVVNTTDTDPSDSLDEDDNENRVDSDKEELAILKVIPMQIDRQQAKLRASLSWLLSKVYGSNVPKELQDPFYETAEGHPVLRPVMVNLMSSSELYCQACSNMFPETHTQWQGHWSIIQVLSRKGIYILEVQESAVTETVLVQTAPFRLKAHLALIDALMKAYTCEVASVEKVVKAVRRITTFPASSELPGTPEEALIFWINKVCAVLETEVSKGRSEEITEGVSGQKVRVSSKVSSQHEQVHVPLLEYVMRDIGDGCSIGAVIAYYRPHLLNIKDLCIAEGNGIADSLHNLCQIGQFCRRHLPWKCFCLSYEDLLYTHEIMKDNIIAFLADLFFYFEGLEPIEAVEPGLGSTRSSVEKVDGMAAPSKKGSQNMHAGVQISQATKRSFHRQGFEETANNLGMGRSAGNSPFAHQPLLSKRIPGRHCIPQEEGGTSATSSTKRSTGRRALSLFSPQDREIVHKSVIAWQDDQRILSRSDERRDGNSEHGRLQANISADSALNQNYSANNNLSLDLSDLETNRSSVSDYSCPDHIGLENVTSFQPSFNLPHPHTNRKSSTTPTPDQRLEPLMPALLKPTKEKEINLSKAEERGDRSPRRKRIMSPTEPQLSLASHTQQAGGAQSPHQRQPLHMENDGGSFNEQSGDLLSLPADTAGGRSPSSSYKQQPQRPRSRAYDAFVVRPESRTEVPLEAKPKQGKFGSNSQDLDGATDISTAGSYTVKDRASSAQAARAAGIPVVCDSEDMTLAIERSREGSVASSGEYSDHESQKIHQEYKVRESGLATTPEIYKVTDANINNNSKPVMFLTDNLNKITSKNGSDDSGIFNKLSLTTTNFAELKRLKDKLGYNLDKVDRNAIIYMQSGSHGGPYDKMSGGDSIFAIKQAQGQQQSSNNSDKTSAIGQHPVVSSSALIPDNATLEDKETNPGSLEMQHLRLKLEQKRKDIERKKHRQEAQQSKMRQQLGQAAFMRVVSKHVDGAVEGESASDQLDSARSEHIPNSTQVQLQARLGHPAQKISLGGSSRSPLPAPQTSLGKGSQNSVIPADASAQRFTDWRTQSQMSRGGGGGGNMSVLAAADSESRNSDQAQQFLLMNPGAVGGSDDESEYSQTPGNKAFSREGIQQTIDAVRNKWFKSDSDLITGGREGSDEEDDAGLTFRLHGEDLLAEARTKTPAIQGQSRTPARSHSQSPLHGSSQFLPAPTDGPMSARETVSSSQPISDMEYQVYDSSLGKLNTSLTELQGEIMRLSLQHEQLKAAQSPVSSHSGGATQSRPIHGIPHQVPFLQGSQQGVPILINQQQPPPTAFLLQQNNSAPAYDHGIPTCMDSSGNVSLNISTENRSAYESGSTPNLLGQNISESDASNGGFFVSFEDNTTPKRPKPKFSDHRSRGVSPAPTAMQASTPSPMAMQATTPSAVTVSNHTADISAEVAANLARQTIIPASSTQQNDDYIPESSPKIGFIIKEESVTANDSVAEDEMQKKRVKLMEMQKKRKEDQEKRRSEKEAEIAKKQEEKQLKEEEHERKKAEEKARREVIFQQYIQKKQEDEESPVKPLPKKRDASANKQRPKSMFVKSKAVTPEPGSLAPDSGSSSQEDLTSRTVMSGRSTPSVMSALRSAFSFRLPEPGQIRKAVSCNTLQGTTNGAQGPSTYRRPPSPDLNRLKQRQRGSNHESGNESSSNSGFEYAGPKLYVKPSAKSNRHIIVNAISHCCLAGSVNTDIKNKVLEEMSKCDANHFVILFRDGGCQYRGLFILSAETEEAFKVHGVGPKHIINAMCEKFYKYNSGAKSFSEITSTKHLSVSIDAVVLHTSVWKSVKAVIKR